MEASVRYIPQEVTVVDKRVIAVGNKPALCFRGTKYALGIINDEEIIKPIRLTLRDYDKSRLVMYNTEEYPVTKFISHLERIMNQKPIDTEALRLILLWPNLPEDFADLDKKLAPIVERPVVQSKKKQSNCIPDLAKEFSTIPQKIRKFLRSKGLHAPYSDESQIRELMKGFKT